MFQLLPKAGGAEFYFLLDMGEAVGGLLFSHGVQSFAPVAGCGAGEVSGTAAASDGAGLRPCASTFWSLTFLGICCAYETWRPGKKTKDALGLHPKRAIGRGGQRSPVRARREGSLRFSPGVQSLAPVACCGTGRGFRHGGRLRWRRSPTERLFLFGL